MSYTPVKTLAEQAWEERKAEHRTDAERAAFLAGYLAAKKPTPIKYVMPTSCNRHDDCAAANEAWKARNPSAPFIPANFHCHDEDCEDCFGQ